MKVSAVSDQFWCDRHGRHGCLYISHGRGRSTSSERHTIEPPPPSPTLPPPPTSTFTTTSRIAPAQQPSEQSHHDHELAPQQQQYFTWDRGGNKPDKNVARVVAALLRAWAAGPEEERLRPDGSLRAASSAGKSLRVQPRRLCSRKEEKYNYSRLLEQNYTLLLCRMASIIIIITIPFSRGKNIYRPAPPPKNKKIPARPAVGENIYSPVPPRGNIYSPSRPAEEKYLPSRPAEETKITVPTRRRKKYLPPRPVVITCPVELYRPIPSRNYAPAVPSRQLFMSSFYRPVVTFFPANEVKYVPSRPAMILSHCCDKPWLF